MSKLNTIIISILLICSLSQARDFDIEFETGPDAPILDKFADLFEDVDNYANEYDDLDYLRETLISYLDKSDDIYMSKEEIDEDVLNAMLQRYEQLQGELQDLERQYEDSSSKYESSYEMNELTYELHSYVVNYENEDFVDTNFKLFSEKLCTIIFYDLGILSALSKEATITLKQQQTL
jgi:hypothetical protein